MRGLHLAGATAMVITLGACSGGGSSTPAAAPSPSLAGGGTTIAIDQKVTFTIAVPAPATAGASKKRATAGAPATTPYVSPATAAIVLTLAEINGLSPQKAPPAIAAIPVRCMGCTFSVPNIPAALGIDRYFVQTYSAYVNGQAAGNVISTGFVDVAVPATNPPTIGGAAALSIGGYVSQISLAPISVNFAQGVASDQSILVRALDAGGATIVGSVQYVSPIVVSVVDAQNFALDGAATQSLAGTLQKPIVLHYTGGNSFGTLVNASSVDENGVTVNATPVAANIVTPTPSPTPTPLPGHTPAPPPSPSPLPSPTLPPPRTSLYIADGALDSVSEYGFLSQLEAGSIPNPVPTPQRVFAFNEPGLIGKIPTLSCTQSPILNVGTYGTAGVAVAGNGTIYTFPNCADAPGNAYVFGFPATSVGPTVPTILDPMLIGFAQYSGPLAYAPAPAPGSIFATFNLGNNNNALAGFPVASNGKQPSVMLGATCYQEFGFSSPCSASTESFGSTVFGASGFGVDANGYAYLPSAWSDNPATGDAGNLNLPAAVLTLPISSSSSVTVPQSALAGLTTLLGGDTPVAATVDGTTLYVLGGGSGQVSSLDGTTNYYEGLSACPAPSANAQVNEIFDPFNPNGPTPPITCVDGQPHLYVVAFTIGAALLGPGATRTDVDLTPRFAIGGDVVGRFGCGPAVGYPPGQFLAASAGYVYVINQNPNCAATAFAPEVDVYNTNGVSGAHTDIGPALVINLNTSVPVALAIGPSGSVTGGQSILRRSRALPFRAKPRHALSRRPAVHMHR